MNFLFKQLILPANFKKGFTRSLWLLGLLVFCNGALLAAITVTTDRDQVALNETFELVFTVSGEQTGEPDFSPLNQDFQLLGTSSSSRISMVNGNTTQSKSYTLRVAPKRAGELVIPPIAFGREHSDAFSIQILETGTAAPDAPGVEDALMVRASVDITSPYVQQQVLLTVKIFRRINWQQAALSELDAGVSDLLVQQLGEDSQYRASVDGKNWDVIERKYALFPQQSGELEISPFQLTVAVPDERQQERRGYNDPFDRLFSRRPVVEKSVRSNAIKLQVKPAVEGVVPWLAASDLKLQENWSADTDQLKAGESLTRTVAIIAEGVSVGQLPELKMGSLESVKSYPDQPQTNEQATGKGLLSTSSRKFALIPARAGDYEIPPLEISWWNVNSDRMETARLPGRVLKVSAAAAPVIEPVPPAQPDVLPVPEVEPAAAPVVMQQPSPWLMYSNGLFLALWLITLYAWWKVRKAGPQPVAEEATEMQDSSQRELIRNLEQAGQNQDAVAARDGIIQLAKTIWPDNPPTSLTQVIRLTEGPLAEELNNLERSLYSAEQTSWDGSLIARDLSGLKPQSHPELPDRAGLKPLYPAASR